jgi:methionyl aminopeptidase
VPTSPEATGDKYSVEGMLDVRRRTREAVHAIAAQVGPGLTEEEAQSRAFSTLTALGLRRGWHRVIVRCGPNTTKSFGEPSDKGVVLANDDIFFVDIGPIYDGLEGDAGETFVVGGDHEHLRAKVDVQAIWDEVRARWLEEQLTGRALYEHALRAASDRGWQLNLDLAGHRLSDFPHSAHYRGSMAGLDLVPSSHLWVLEIAIVHPTRPFGAFFEDLLLEDQSFLTAAPGVVS